MTRRILIAALAFLSAASLWADGSYLSYVEGEVTLEKPGADQRYAEIGDAVAVGDTVYTAADSRAEIALKSGSTVTIGEESVFNVGEVADPEAESRKRGFFRVLLGSVSFKFRNLSKEPDIGTPLTVCSVRGTDFTVYAAPDGASMTVVSDGLVEVSSGGAVALLSAGEGVEASAGLGLGEPFEAKKGHIAYDDFVEEALKRTDENPIAVLEALAAELEQMAEQGAFYFKSWEMNLEEQDRLNKEIVVIREEQGTEASDKAYYETLRPLMDRTMDLNRTYRHYLVSGLYLRRYILSSYYVRMRTRYLTDSTNSDWMGFQETYEKVLAMYEMKLIPQLIEEDL